jgi:hypothetical protein
MVASNSNIPLWDAFLMLSLFTHLFSFGNTGVLTQVLMCARWVLFLLSCALSPIVIFRKHLKRSFNWPNLILMPIPDPNAVSKEIQ